ncbi:facilitated trehalose transporter Tret1-like [Sitodiplosis mosellana]|uniref:facilitated trehalose transporter Tret1-like n=1 Tax=Sitodiplosis mosellana TaxID=263140 RepID=UPI002444FAEF|nr:facilitated trehalose transporter Tret1-like [Sitodiplosis mosellana]
MIFIFKLIIKILFIEQEAERSIKFYQNLRDGDSEKLHFEMNKLTESLCKQVKSNGDSFDWLYLLTNPGRKALTIGVVLSVLSPLSGSITISTYAGAIFEAAGSTIPPNISVIAVGVVQLLGTLITTNFIERAGRKVAHNNFLQILFLYIVSTNGTALGLVVLGVFMMLKSWQYNVESFDWIPIVSFSLAIFSAAWAIMSLPFVIISEILPEKLKDFGANLCSTLLWSFGFIVPKYFPFFTDIIGYHGTMFLFAGFCLLGSLFVSMCLPETKGKSRDQIMDMLR